MEITKIIPAFCLNFLYAFCLKFCRICFFHSLVNIHHLTYFIGYLAYLGFLFVEHQHSNPVLQCFARILLQTQNKEMLHTDLRTYKESTFPSISFPFFFFFQRNSKVLFTFQPLLLRFYNNELEYIFNVSFSEHESNISKVLAMNEIHPDEIDATLAYSRNRKFRARNRWFLFLMLSQNPSLIKYRSRFLKRRRTKKYLENIFSVNTFNDFEVQPEEEVNVEAVEDMLNGRKLPLSTEEERQPEKKCSLLIKRT